MGLAAVIGILMSITVTQVGDSGVTCQTTDLTFNPTTRLCFNASNESLPNSTPTDVSFNITNNANAGLGSIFDQYSLIGLMIGLGIVLVVLVGVFGFLRFRNAGV